MTPGQREGRLGCFGEGGRGRWWVWVGVKWKFMNVIGLLVFCSFFCWSFWGGGGLRNLVIEARFLCSALSPGLHTNSEPNSAKYYGDVFALAKQHRLRCRSVVSTFFISLKAFHP